MGTKMTQVLCSKCSDWRGQAGKRISERSGCGVPLGIAETPGRIYGCAWSYISVLWPLGGRVSPFRDVRMEPLLSIQDISDGLNQFGAGRIF